MQGHLSQPMCLFQAHPLDKILRTQPTWGRLKRIRMRSEVINFQTPCDWKAKLYLLRMYLGNHNCDILEVANRDALKCEISNFCFWFISILAKISPVTGPSLKPAPENPQPTARTHSFNFSWIKLLLIYTYYVGMSWMPIQNVNQIRRNCKNAGFFNGRSWLNIWKTTWNEIFQLLFFAGNVNHIPSFRINAGSSVQANLIHSFIFKLSCAPHSYIGILMVKIVWNMTIRLPIKYWNFDNFQWQLPTKTILFKIVL